LSLYSCTIFSVNHPLVFKSTNYHNLPDGGIENPVLTIELRLS
jgi:hypothetical protein